MTSLVDCNRIISELILLIKADIKQLRAGNYNDVQRLSVLKVEKTGMLAAALKEFSSSKYFRQAEAALRDQLTLLNALGNENGKLLLAVSGGVKSAGQRINRLQNTHTQVGVYGRKGTSISFAEDPATSEKKF